MNGNRVGPTRRNLPLLMLAVVTAALALSNARVLVAHDGSRVDLDNIIENVRRNEVLYRDLEVRLRAVYDIGDREPEFLGDEMREVTDKDVRIRYVTQDELFRLEMEGANYDSEGSVTRDRIRAFDGKTTRVYEQNAYGNIVSGRADDENLVRPHMLLFQNRFLTAPLSIYLEGHEAMAAHMAAQSIGTSWRSHHVLVNSYQGEADFQGLRCHRVWITEHFSGQPHNRWELWLAEERNYIPVRQLAWTFRHSKDIPLGEGVVDEWREIEPGIWFPTAAQITSYNPVELERHGRQRLQWRERYVVGEVSLEPDYDLDFFQDVEFPEGTAVYEVDDGEIVKSYRVGAPAAAQAPPSSAVGSRWLLWVNLAVFTGLATVWLVRRFFLAKAASTGEK